MMGGTNAERSHRAWFWWTFSAALFLYGGLCSLIAYFAISEGWRSYGLFFVWFGKYAWATCAVVAFASGLFCAAIARRGPSWTRTGRNVTGLRFPSLSKWQTVMIAFGLLMALAATSLLVLSGPKNLLLSRASAGGNVSMAHIALWLGANPVASSPGEAGEYGPSPLALAAANGHGELVDILLPHSNGLEIRGPSPLTMAVNNENWGIARRLLQKGYIVSESDLLAALVPAPFELAEQMVERSDVDRRSHLATRVVFCAAKRESSDLLELLLSVGFYVNGGYGRAGETPLDLAVASDHRQAARRLLQNGAMHSVLYEHEHGGKELDYLPLKRAQAIRDMLSDSSHTGWRRLTDDLSGCVQTGRAIEVELLLDAGADPRPSLAEAERWLHRAKLDIRAAKDYAESSRPYAERVQKRARQNSSRAEQIHALLKKAVDRYGRSEDQL